ncbi:MAG TPA: rRNA (cytidine-2'-O-)-methyltransferase, partial [Pseudomonadales bacterium]
AVIPVAVVFFEAARRLRDTLKELVEITDADRRILLAKELTKIHERIESGTVAELTSRLDDDEFFERGEFVCVLAPPPTAIAAAADTTALMQALCDELPPAQAARIAARVTHKPRSELYEYALKLRRGS